jgi:hypothetical protein
MKRRQSQILAQHFRIVPPSDLERYLDDPGRAQIFRGLGDPIDVAGLINPRTSTVWGGMMLPDTLPILNNGGGDVLCVRVDEQGAIGSYLWWNHETGNWLFAGSTFSEALSFVYARGAMEGGGPVEALPTLPGAMGAWVRCRSHLLCPLIREFNRLGGRRIAEAIGAPWEILREALFDTDRIPDEIRPALIRELRAPKSELLRQDWNAAAEEAMRANEDRPELNWPYAVLGWAAERAGNFNLAAQVYERGIFSWGSSEDLAREWMLPRSVQAKFVARRLIALAREPSSAEIGRYLAAAHQRSGIRKYWIQRGEAAEREGRFAEAYAHYCSAGWDDFVTNERELLEAIHRTCVAAGFEARAEVVGLHLQSI